MNQPTHDSSAEFWILKTLEFGPANMAEVARWIQHIDTVQFEAHTLADTLEALAVEGLIDSDWALSDRSRVMSYRVTAVGQQYLSTLTSSACS